MHISTSITSISCTWKLDHYNFFCTWPPTHPTTTLYLVTSNNLILCIVYFHASSAYPLLSLTMETPLGFSCAFISNCILSYIHSSINIRSIVSCIKDTRSFLFCTHFLLIHTSILASAFQLSVLRVLAHSFFPAPNIQFHIIMQLNCCPIKVSL